MIKDKDASVRGQDFEKAGQLRDREMELKAKIQAVIAGAKEQSKAEADSVEGGGPQVTEADIASIVAQWTGIPIEKVMRGGGIMGSRPCIILSIHNCRLSRNLILLPHTPSTHVRTLPFSCRCLLMRPSA